MLLFFLNIFIGSGTTCLINHSGFR